MGTDMGFTWFNMVLKKLGDLGIIQIFVGRERKGQAAILEGTEKLSILR